jgi:hypothetical protein
MTRLTMNDASCEALFASGLQRSDAPAPEALTDVIRRTVQRFGITGCAGRMAQEFGDHPDAAATRMRWARQLAVWPQAGLPGGHDAVTGRKAA